MKTNQRRPIRAFILTPVIFLFLFAILFWVRPIFEVETDSISQYASESLSFFATIFVFGLPIAYLGAAVAGIPAYFLMRKTKYETVVTCVVTTAIIAAIVYFFLEVDISPPPEGSSFSYGDSGGEIIENNKRTPYGWKVFLFSISQIVVLGAISGLFFWRIYSGKWWGRITSSDNE